MYGTGFYYTPWRGHFFYPRPWTWGFNMWYDPWLGWSFGYDYDWDWFNWGFGLGFGFGGWWGGWWGPMVYRPAYVGRGFARGGFYGRHDLAGSAAEGSAASMAADLAEGSTVAAGAADLTVEKRPFTTSRVL